MNIELREGEQAEILVTPALYRVAKQRGLNLSMDSGDGADVFDVYAKLIYCAAINAWEVRAVDDTSIGTFPYKYGDFVEWLSAEKGRFTEMVKFCYAALTGKNLEDGIQESIDYKKKRADRL